jgi:hypothetical protein
MSDLTIIQEEVKKELANPEVYNALLKTTFKGLSEDNMKLAITDGIIRGFDFKDFRERNVYAISYGNTYSLVTSIDYARKIGAKSGVVGEDEPVYTQEKEGEKDLGLACSMTVHKMFANGHIGDFKAKVYFNEYSTGRNLWVSKPRTMIAKVAEMHALRKACPEELAQNYVEEEMERDTVKPATVIHDMTEYEAKLVASESIEELKMVWASLPAEAKKELIEVKESLKKKFEPAAKPEEPKESPKQELPNVNEDPNLR